MKKIITILSAASVCFMGGLPVVHALEQADSLPSKSVPVGTIEYSKGVTSVQGQTSGSLIAGKGTIFSKKDVITTGKKSFAILKLTDGTRLTLRPDSKFSVDEFNPSRNQNASATLRLFKGGLRAVTGFVSKFNRDGYKMRTPVATIGIRGTEFDARLCDELCQKENQKLKKKLAPRPNAIGRLAFVKGPIAAKNKDGTERFLKRGMPVYEGDMMVTGRQSFAVIAFKDQSRITLQPSSQMAIQKFKYGEEPKNQLAQFGLLKGGLRAVTGLIGKFRKESYRMRTPVATIGIRGTGFDLWNAPPEGQFTIGGAPTQSDGGMFLGVWEGGIDVEQNGNIQPLDNGQFGFVSDSASGLMLLDISDLPDNFKDNIAPRPDEIQVEDNFVDQNTNDVKPGLYVQVYDGLVTMGEGEQEIEITRDTGPGFFSESEDGAPPQPELLDAPPPIITFDTTPLPNQALPEENEADIPAECRLI